MHFYGGPTNFFIKSLNLYSDIAELMFTQCCQAMSYISVTQVTLTFYFHTLLCFGNKHKDYFSVSYNWRTIEYFFHKVLIWVIWKINNLVTYSSAVTGFPLKQVQNFETVLNNYSNNHLKQSEGMFPDFFLNCFCYI